MKAYYLMTKNLNLPKWLLDAIKISISELLTLFGISGIVTSMLFTINLSVLNNIHYIANSLIDLLGLTLLAFLYVPSIIIGVIANLVGSSTHIGSVDLTGSTLITDRLRILLLIIEISTTIIFERYYVKSSLSPTKTFNKLLISTFFTTVMLFLFGYVGGGKLGNLGTFGVNNLTFAPIIFLRYIFINGISVIINSRLVQKN